MFVLFSLTGKAWQVFDTWQFMLQKFGGNTKLGQLPQKRITQNLPAMGVPQSFPAKYSQSLN